MAASAELLEEAQLRFTDGADPATPQYTGGSGRLPANQATPGSDASAQTANQSPDTSGRQQQHQQQQQQQQQTHTAQHVGMAASRSSVSDTPQQTSGLSVGSAAMAPLDLHTWAQDTGNSTSKSGYAGHPLSVSSGGKENLWLTPVLGSKAHSASPVRSASPGKRRSHLLPAFDSLQQHRQHQHSVSVTSQQAAASTTPAVHGQPSPTVDSSSRTAEKAQPTASPRATSLQPGEHRTEVWLRMQSASPPKRRHHHQQQQQREASVTLRSAGASGDISTVAPQSQQSSGAGPAAADGSALNGAAPTGTAAVLGHQSHSDASTGRRHGRVSASTAAPDRASTAAAAAAIERCRAEVQADAERLAALETRLTAQQAEFAAQKSAADAVLLREQVSRFPVEPYHL